MTLVRDSNMDPFSASYPAPDGAYPVHHPSQQQQQSKQASPKPARPIGELTMTRGGKEAERERSKEGDDVERIRDAIAAGVITVYAPRRKTTSATDESGMTTTTTIETTTTASTNRDPSMVALSLAEHSSQVQKENSNDNQIRTLIPQMSLTTEEGEETSEFRMDDDDVDGGGAEGDAVSAESTDHGAIPDDALQPDSERNGTQTNSENELTQDSIESGGTVIDVAASRSGKKTAETNKPANLILPSDSTGEISTIQARTTETIQEEDRLEPLTPSNVAGTPQQHHQQRPPLSASASISTPASPSFFFHYGSLTSPSSLHPPPSPIPDIVLPPRSESEMELAAVVGDAVGTNAADEGRQVHCL